MRQGRMVSRIGIVMVVIALLAAGFASGTGPAAAQDGGDVEYTWSGDVNAPDFPAGADWINTTGPISMADLRGKIVLLDFWTYGCINCIHVIPDLKRLEAEYPDSLVVIGVHSAKFDNEGETENIRRIVQRYGVEHPVINDQDFEVWNAYGVRAWPTFMVIDPFGKVVGSLSGEPLYGRVQPILDTMAQEYGAAGVINPEPLPQWAPETAGDPTALRFPGKVLADPAGNRLFISDSNHNRIVIAALDTYAVQAVIGSGEEGLADGDYATAQFFRPQGLALDGDTLYVADTSNHAIRAIDLAAETVRTVAGTGEQNLGGPTSGPGDTIALSSPWDVTVDGQTLYIAMAGPHQLWALDLASGEVAPYAGSGREALSDGPLAEAAFNQPSGIDTDGERLYVADPEASAIRVVDITPAIVETLVGTGLFDFGDVDGSGDDVRLQHPLGITVADDGLLYVADTYNNKIKRIDPAARESTTFLGSGEPGQTDGSGTDAQFYEPGGIDYADGKLYIADTNNHAIRVADLASGAVTTVTFPNPQALGVDEAAAVSEPGTAPAAEEPTLSTVFGGPAGTAEIAQPPQTVAPGEGTIQVQITMPDGYKFNDLAPFTANWPDDPVVQIPADQRTTQILEPEMPLEVPVTFAEGQTEIAVNLAIYWCEAINESLCFVDRATLVAPVTVSADAGANTLVLQHSLTPPVIDETLN